MKEPAGFDDSSLANQEKHYALLMYSLGNFLVSADDDMRPPALVEGSPESLNADEVSRGMCST